MKKMKKIICLITAAVISLSLLSACGTGANNTDGKVHITIAAWPSPETNKAQYDLYQKYLDAYKSKYPDVEVTTDEWRFDLKNYLVKAAAKQLPTTFTIAPTELDTLINSGYIRDITKAMTDFGYLEGYDKKYEFVYMRDGKAYAVVDPESVYEMGLLVNVDLFKKAGLTDKKGLPKYPQTWDEVAEFSKTIKEKTGKAGFVMPTKERHGGWEFTNIAWSYGADFLEKTGDGKYKAIFASDEAAEALQFIKDLKWEANALQEEALVSIGAIQKLVGTGEAAMGIIQSGMVNGIPKSYGTPFENLAMCRIPAGPKGRFAFSSANIYVVSGETTDEELEALMNWFNMIGMGPEVNAEMIEKWEESYKAKAEEGQIVGIKPSMIWKSGERREKQIEAMNKYTNINPELYEDYVSADDITFRADPEKCAQELYDVIDSALQKVLTDKNADVKDVLKKAQDNFQVNFLDKE